MSIQVGDSDVPGPPKFSYDGSITGGKPLGRVYYDGDEIDPLLSQSVTALSNKDVKKSFISQSEELSKEAALKRRKRWISIYVMYFTMFLTSLTFSIIISSVWPYLRKVDPNATTKLLGWVVASYSFGQLFASPILGLWADYRRVREPFLVSVFSSIVFNIVYAYAGAFDSDVSSWIMILSRFLIGFGAGIGAVARSYVSEATTNEERMGAMAFMSSSQALGFIVGPVLGLVFVPFGYNGVSIPAIKFNLNIYTGPGFFSSFMGLLNLVIFLIFFRESRLVDRETKKRLEEKKEEEFVLTIHKQKHYDRLAAFASIIINFVILSGFSVFETILSPLAMDEFAWTSKQVVFYNNIFFSGISFVSIASMISVKYITKKVDERVVLMTGLFLLAFTFYVLLPMGSEPPQQKPAPSPNQTTEAVGCMEPTWCPHVPRIYLFQVLVSLFLLTPGFAASSVTLFSIYSRILGPFPQGIMMGVLTAAGSFARGLGPMGVSTLYRHYGPMVTFTSVVGTIAVCILFTLACSPRLIPYERYARKQ